MADEIASEEEEWVEVDVLPVSIPSEGLRNGQWRLEALFASISEKENDG